MPLTSEPVAPIEAEPSDDFLKDDIFEDFSFFVTTLLPFLLLFEVRDLAAFGIGEGFTLFEVVLYGLLLFPNINLRDYYS